MDRWWTVKKYSKGNTNLWSLVKGPIQVTVQYQQLAPFTWLQTEEYHRLITEQRKILYVCFVNGHTKSTHAILLLAPRNVSPLSRVMAYALTVWHIMKSLSVTQDSTIRNTKRNITLVSATPLLPTVCHPSKIRLMRPLLPWFLHHCPHLIQVFAY